MQSPRSNGQLNDVCGGGVVMLDGQRCEPGHSAVGHGLRIDRRSAAASS